ncbi:MAG: phosphoglycerate dehydrogenase [Anaerolineaceae bacterium]|nr:phosphoglycerate dehydrogenase [Anaerolineaceae bacterium]
MVPKVLIATRSFGSSSPRPMQTLKDAGVEIVCVDANSPDVQNEILNLVPDISAIIVGLVPITEKIIQNSSKLKIISMYGVGVNHIDLKSAQEKGIIVTNCPGSNDQAVADLAMGLMLTVARNIPQIDQDIRAGYWNKYQGGEIWQKKLGLIGFGNIAKGVAHRAKGFDMQICAFDPYASAEVADSFGVKLIPFEELISTSDFVSLHAPLTEETKTMFSTKQFEQMKPTSYLINTARGGLIDEQALFEALSNGKISGAGLDVFVEEPLKNSRLIELKNVVLTAHTGTHTKESIERMGMMAVENVLRVLNDEIPINRIV